MYFNEPNTLDPRIIQKAEQLRKLLTSDAKLRVKFNKRFTTDTDPPMLQMFHSSYRQQCLLEVARHVVHHHMAQKEAIGLFFKWLPALVNHYHKTKGHNMVVAYATARTKCVDEFTEEFLFAYIKLLVENDYSVATGASTTGGMGFVTRMMSEQIKKVGTETTKSRTFGVRLGLIRDVGQGPAEEIDHNAPPLYIFALRMYYLNLIGGCPDADKECRAKAGKPVRRNRVILPGGFGSIGEGMSDLVEFQTSKFAHTTYSHVMKQEYPRYIFVGPSANAINAYYSGDRATELLRVAEKDRKVISKWEEIRQKGIEADEIDDLSLQKRIEMLNPLVEEMIALLPGSGMFYRGLLLQFVDCIVTGTVSARELIPVSFVEIENATQAAQKVFDLQNSERCSIEELHEGHKINYCA